MQFCLTFFQLLRHAMKQFLDDHCLDLAARLSYYTALSLAPLLIITLKVAGFIWNEENVAGALLEQASRFIGPTGVDLVQNVMKAGAAGWGSGWIAASGLVTFVLAGTAAFTDLQDTINHIWGVRAAPGRGLWAFFYKRIVSLIAIGSLGGLLFLSLTLSSLLTLSLDQLQVLLELDRTWALSVGSTMTSLLLSFVIFSSVFKFLPHVWISWRNVWVGAALTAGLFEVGKTLIKIYLLHSPLISAYGAATSLLAVLVWVYYSALILFFGAEFIQAYAHYRQRPPVPARHAVSIDSRH